MTKVVIRLIVVMLMAVCTTQAQVSTDPFPTPIPATDRVITVKFAEFATIPDFNGAAPRIMTMLNEPGTRRLFASDMNGKLYSISYDGKTVTPYLDLTAPDWKVGVQAQGSERGLQSFAFHPQFSQTGARGYGKFYTYLDTTNTTVAADFKPLGGNHTHDLVLLEWTTKTPTSATYDGGAPREVVRLEEPFANHNGGHLTFNPLATAASPDFGLLYVGLADGGSGGDPLGHGQNLNVALGKILRLDPLGTNSANGKYGIPASNPFVNDGKADTLGEIYAYGVRNPQRLFWDSKNGNMFMSDIGQDTVEKVSAVTAGANLGWNVWEGSFKFVGGGRPTRVDVADPRTDAKITYPIAEYGQLDPLLQGKMPATRADLRFAEGPDGQIFLLNKRDGTIRVLVAGQ